MFMISDVYGQTMGSLQELKAYFKRSDWGKKKRPCGLLVTYVFPVRSTCLKFPQILIHSSRKISQGLHKQCSWGPRNLYTPCVCPPRGRLEDSRTTPSGNVNDVAYTRRPCVATERHYSGQIACFCCARRNRIYCLAFRI